MRVLLLAAALAMAATPHPAAATPDRRILLAFAPTDTDPALAAQRHILASAAAGMTERDLVLRAVIGTDHAMDALRARYDAPASGFLVLLIGKDGGVKLRSGGPVTAEALFALIDAMPMRRAERARR